MSFKENRAVKKVTSLFKRVFKKKEEKELDPATALSLVLLILLLPVIFAGNLGKKK